MTRPPFHFFRSVDLVVKGLIDAHVSGEPLPASALAALYGAGCAAFAEGRSVDLAVKAALKAWRDTERLRNAAPSAKEAVHCGTKNT
jgi:hypothetical protein